MKHRAQGRAESGMDNPHRGDGLVMIEALEAEGAEPHRDADGRDGNQRDGARVLAKGGAPPGQFKRSRALGGAENALIGELARRRMVRRIAEGNLNRGLPRFPPRGWKPAPGFEPELRGRDV